MAALTPATFPKRFFFSVDFPEAVIVHELSHAYHSICYRDGVTNNKIREAYLQGVAAGYYDTRKKTCSRR